MPRRPQLHSDVDACVEAVLSEVGTNVVLAVPMGIGKPNHFVNALYRRAKSDPSITLRILSALTLETPVPTRDLERRILGPIVERLYAGYPDLEYALDRRAGRLPPNVEVNEFFLLTGRLLGCDSAQRNFVSCNYTHVVRNLLDFGVNVAAQSIARDDGPGGPAYSLSSNPDVALDLRPALETRRAQGQAIAAVGQVNRKLPFMTGDAIVDAEQFDHIVESPAYDFPPFAVPRMPVSLADYATGLHLSTLVKDGGTIQIGIGSIGDAVTYALKLRHEDNALYRRLVQELGTGVETGGYDVHLEPFDAGLYAATEMFVEGFLDLYRAGILRRPALDDRVRAKAGVDAGDDADAVLHAAFFLGGSAFYDALRRLNETERAALRMKPVSFINQLYGDEALKRAQRRDARFINNAMMATLLGAVVSDGLEDGRMVSGVGGQYNFVAMAHALADARSIIALSSTRPSRAGLKSNIVWQYANATIPRHLRDLVVTEYGIAALRGRCDREVIARMLQVADSRFQDALLASARKARKIEADFRLPEAARDNTPARLARVLAPHRAQGYFPPLPFGSDLTEEEAELIPALERLRWAAARRIRIPSILASATRQAPPDGRESELLARLDLREADSLRERLLRALVLWALRAE